MSPLWGFGAFVYPVYYTHIAPLGLNEPMNKLFSCFTHHVSLSAFDRSAYQSLQTSTTSYLRGAHKYSL